MDREAWWDTFYGVAKSRTLLCDLDFHVFFFLTFLIFFALFNPVKQMKLKYKC